MAKKKKKPLADIFDDVAKSAEFSRTHSWELKLGPYGASVIREAIAAGVRHPGKNRRPLYDKMAALLAEHDIEVPFTFNNFSSRVSDAVSREKAKNKS